MAKAKLHARIQAMPGYIAGEGLHCTALQARPPAQDDSRATAATGAGLQPAKTEMLPTE
jgi:hypothetical protein